MTAGAEIRPIMAYVELRCSQCENQWASEVFKTLRGARAEAPYLEPAWELGWRIYSGKRRTHVYCPNCRPLVPMRLLHGTEN